MTRRRRGRRARSIPTHRLRQKLEQAGAGQMVQTVRGVGWRLTRSGTHRFATGSSRVVTGLQRFAANTEAGG